MIEPPLVDAARLRRISGGDAGLLAELVELFVVETERRLAQVEAAVAAGDAGAATRALHALRGSAHNFGAPHLGALAGELESAAQSGPLAAGAVTGLRDSFDATRRALAAKPAAP